MLRRRRGIVGLVHSSIDWHNRLGTGPVAQIEKVAIEGECTSCLRAITAGGRLTIGAITDMRSARGAGRRWAALILLGTRLSGREDEELVERGALKRRENKEFGSGSVGIHFGCIFEMEAGT